MDLRTVLVPSQKIGLTEFKRRFYNKTTPVPECGCLLWLGNITADGYGLIWNPDLDKSVLVHRVAWELDNGPFDPSLSVCHKCDVPLCVNTNHLFLGTHTDNMRDRCKKGRNNPPAGERFWKHKLTSEKVLDIRRKSASGIPNVTLAKEYRIDRTHVWSIVTRQTWKNI